MKKRNSQFLTFSFESDITSKTLKGYAIKFNELSQINEDHVGKWATKITPGLTLEDKVDVYYEHDHKAILASTKNQSLKLKTDNTGVFFEFTLGDTQLQRDVYELVKQGLLNSMSFGVQITDDEWVTETYNNEEIDVRLVKAGKVYEISAVNNPAFISTQLLVASNDDPARTEYLAKKSNTTLFSDDDAVLKQKLQNFLNEQEDQKKALLKKQENEREEQKKKEENQIKLDLAKAKLRLHEVYI